MTTTQNKVERGEDHETHDTPNYSINAISNQKNEYKLESFTLQPHLQQWKIIYHSLTPSAFILRTKFASPNLQLME